ncbi:MAG: hypothetical protein H6Q57_1755 [Geobacteraceae bacterium]|nr:hypothetical protein [Geobacteraceae bacterium]
MFAKKNIDMMGKVIYIQSFVFFAEKLVRKTYALA